MKRILLALWIVGVAIAVYATGGMRTSPAGGDLPMPVAGQGGVLLRTAYYQYIWSFNGYQLTNLQPVGVQSTNTIWASTTQALTLNNDLSTVVLSAAGSITNTTLTGYATLFVTNSTAGALALYITNATWRPMGQMTTNVAPSGTLSVPGGRVCEVFIDNRTGATIYSCTLQQ